jgi:NADH:ubiquinone oxidoreductase subunit E
MYEIKICLGSSCFSRGNSENLRVIQEYLAARGLAAQVATIGHLCEDQCSLGPNLIVNGVMHHAVDAAGVRVLLDRMFGEGGNS